MLFSITMNLEAWCLFHHVQRLLCSLFSFVFSGQLKLPDKWGLTLLRKHPQGSPFFLLHLSLIALDKPTLRSNSPCILVPNYLESPCLAAIPQRLLPTHSKLHCNHCSYPNALLHMEGSKCFIPYLHLYLAHPHPITGSHLCVTADCWIDFF